MKKFFCVFMTFTFCMICLMGCGKRLNVEESTVYVDKKGTVISVDIEQLDQSYYDETELKTFIEEQVSNYQQSHGQEAKMSDFKVEDGEAVLKMEYDDCDAYTDFNGIELYSGSILEARAEGYDFETDFYSVEEDKVPVTKDVILEEEDNQVVIIRKGIDVKVDGRVLYVSGKNVEKISKDTVSIPEPEEESEEEILTYIVYK